MINFPIILLAVSFASLLCGAASANPLPLATKPVFANEEDSHVIKSLLLLPRGVEYTDAWYSMQLVKRMQNQEASGRAQYHGKEVCTSIE